MSVFHENMLVGASGQGGAGGGGAYQISRSLRFNSADGAYLNRLFASAGNRKTWTWSGWVKRSALGTAHLFACTIVNSDSQYLRLIFNANQLQLSAQSSIFRRSTALFRDTSAWQHIVCALDTTQATAANRVKLYVNGLQLTDFSVSADPTLNADLGFNQAAQHYIGTETGTTRDLNCYLAEVHFIDGQALTPGSFGETDANTGEWIPKAYNGTYGTNGFRLDFADNSAATAAALGKDTSGNGNNWTPNNLSVTAGAGNDSLVDTPTSYGTDTGAGGEVRGNYCTLNPLASHTSTTLSNGNLDAVITGTNAKSLATVGVASGKWYWEVTPVTGADNGVWAIGVAVTSVPLNTYPGQDALSYSWYAAGTKINNGSQVAYASYTTNDVIGVALDLTAQTLTFYKNGVSQGVAYTGLPSGTYTPTIGYRGTFVVNFGQRPFAYTAPSEFKALCDTSLPTPIIVKPSTVMDVLTWTGSGALGRSFTGLGFSPDLVWGKIRTGNATWPHHLYDTVRGAGANKELHSNTSEAEGVTSTGSTGSFGYISSFDANGFTTSSTTANDYWNNASMTYVAWCWDAGSSTVTNTAGTISSQVRANASAGFSVVTYTATSGVAGTVGHGLGIAPDMMILKRRTVAGSNWLVYFRNRTDTTAANAALYLNSTSGGATNNVYPWNSTHPTSSVFSIGGTDIGQYGTMVAYCFAPVAGYSAFGSYTGNGSADGPFVYTGFRPQWILIKQTTSLTTTSWILFDARRIGYNANNNSLYLNTADAEFTSASPDIVSNGFKIRSTSTDVNNNTGTYVYAAFAEFPFQYARAR